MAQGSIVIPAHNEATVIARCLTALFTDPRVEGLEIIVSCNGCTDGTPDVVRSLQLPVRVLETTAASKPAALRLADAATDVFPRIYLDADVMLPGGSAIALLDRLTCGDVAAARPVARYDVSRSSPVVRRFYRARSAVPGLNQSLWGAGVYAVSSDGRRRFGAFPDVVGDDLFVDQLFRRDEIAILDCAPVVVQAPRTTRGLVAMLRRSYRGKAEARRAGSPATPATATLAGVLRYARLGAKQSLDAASYVGLVLVARTAAQTAVTPVWERDNSSRVA